MTRILRPSSVFEGRAGSMTGRSAFEVTVRAGFGGRVAGAGFGAGLTGAGLGAAVAGAT
ncbi:hypothetical protein [Nonomuraea maheshkhaliensis]|uniref:hypothetical protein n=1 Tax=Nonomuraea maheshkhaliensis TaxID=419590 RepID=UPI0031FA0C6A